MNVADDLVMITKGHGDIWYAGAVDMYVTSVVIYCVVSYPLMCSLLIDTVCTSCVVLHCLLSILWMIKVMYT